MKKVKNPVALAWIAIVVLVLLYVGREDISFSRDGAAGGYFEKQYADASNPEERCFFAGMVADDFLNKRDLENYELWQAIKARDCTNARPIKYDR